MSTKIFNTYFLNKSLFDTFLFLKKIQPTILNIAKDEVCKKVANIYADYHDSCKLGHFNAVKDKYNVSSDSGDFENIDFYRYFFEKEKSLLRTDIDFAVDVCAFPYSPTETVIQFFVNNNFIYNKIVSLMEENNIKSFDYYDNVDMPDDISVEEWEQREKDWERLLPSGVPLESSFSFCMTNLDLIYKQFDFYIKKEDVSKYIKDPKERAKDIVFDDVIVEIIKKEIGEKISFSNIIKAKKILKENSHYKEVLERKAEEIYQKIK